jgi:predicted dehydrogenase
VNHSLPVRHDPLLLTQSVEIWRGDVKVRDNVRDVLALLIALAAAPPPELRVGLVGLDTTHVVEFTALLNDAANPRHVAGARVTAAFRGGSPDVEASATRIDKFTATLRDTWKIPIVPSIAALVQQVDAVMITSVDGRVHLAQSREVFPAHKPTFIDKPLAASAADARQILTLSHSTHTPFFSTSSLRYASEIQALASDGKQGKITGAIAWGPAPTEPHHPDLFWYGVHAVEILYTLMGPGCLSVTRATSPGADLVTGRWADGRLGTIRGLRDAPHVYGAVAFATGAVTARQVQDPDYRGLLLAMVQFFRTGKPPVPPEVTVEMMEFMQAAETSKTRGGLEIPLPR